MKGEYVIIGQLDIIRYVVLENDPFTTIKDPII